MSMDQPSNRVRQAISKVGDQVLDVLEREVGERAANVDQLRIVIKKNGHFFGFAQKIVVPPDQIHVVTGNGWHSFIAKSETNIFGQAVGKPSIYPVNNLTVITPMSTLTFMVPVRGPQDLGFEVLDKNNVKYTVTAHVVAKLDLVEDKVRLAAQRVGRDINGLVTNIQEIVEAELHDAAATMSLEEVIKNRQSLAQTARNSVNQTLQELGYSLVLLKIGELGGIAYSKLVEQAEAIVERDSTIAINAAQLATNQSTNERQRTEAEVTAQTLRTTKAQELQATRDVSRATIDTEEELSVRRHELSITEQTREQALAAAKHIVKLEQVELDRTAELARTQSQEAVSLSRQQLEQQRALDATTAEAKRLAEEQGHKLERDTELAQREAAILLQQEQDNANRTKIVATTNAQAQADALQITTEAHANARLKEATTNAQASVQDAEAAQKRAEAKRAEEAAPGLALADVEARQVEIEANRVAVKRDEGLAEAVVAKEQAASRLHLEQGLLEIELKRANEQAVLFAEHPELVQIELQKLAYAHQEQVVRMQTEAVTNAIAAIAPNVHFNLYGDSGQLSRFVTSMMSLGHGISTLSEVPVLGQYVNGHGNGDLPVNLMGMVQPFLPYIKQVISGMNPRVISTLTVGQLIEELVPVVKGEATLTEALNTIRGNAQFKVLADFPVEPILEKLSIPTVADGDVIATTH